MSRQIPTAQFASVVYGEGVELDDPAESYHEAAKLHPSTAAQQMRGVRLVEEHTELASSIARASRRHPHRARTPLPEPSLPGVRLAQALRCRRSMAPAPDSRLSSAGVAALLAAAGSARRYAPSAGALYPLELYLLPSRVNGIGATVHHYDSEGHSLADLERPLAPLQGALVSPDLARDAAAFVAVTAVFWRSRFKYGQRGYRFALLEAGHVVQNLLLVATGLGLAALPLGGYYDGALDHLLGIDGVDESAVYLVAIGSRSDP